MKRIIGLIAAVLFAASVVPAFGEQPKQEDNLFKIVQGTINLGPVKEKNRVKNPLPKVSLFQNLANGINEGSAKARNESLRAAK